MNPESRQKVSRRLMLQRGAWIFAAGALGGSLSARAETSPRRIRVGFLGAAYSHFAEKHKLLLDSADFEMIGVFEEDRSVRERLGTGVNWRERAAVIGESELIVVESRVEHHARDAMAALSAGRHVHVEKPPAARRGEFERMARLARSSGRLLQVGYMWRYNPGFEKALEAARSGWLGDIYLVRATMNTLIGEEQRRQWARFPGGAMFEQGSHLVDVVVRLLGRPRRVTPFLQRRERPASPLADNTIAVLEYPRAMAILTSAPLQPNAGEHRFLEILGTRGTARVQPIEAPRLTLDLAADAGPYVKGRQDVPLPPFKRYVDEFRTLARCIREGQPLQVSPEKELEIQTVLLEACGG